MKEIENKVSSSSFILKSIGMPEPQKYIQIIVGVQQQMIGLGYMIF